MELEKLQTTKTEEMTRGREGSKASSGIERGTGRNDGMITHLPLLQPTSHLGSGSAESGIDVLRSQFIPVCGLLDNHKMGIYRFPLPP